jgi:hypothetical protein
VSAALRKLPNISGITVQLLNPNKDEKEEKMVILDENIKDLLRRVSSGFYVIVAALSR